MVLQLNYSMACRIQIWSVSSDEKSLIRGFEVFRETYPHEAWNMKRRTICLLHRIDYLSFRKQINLTAF